MIARSHMLEYRRRGQRYEPHGRAGFAGDLDSAISIPSEADPPGRARPARGSLPAVRDALEPVCQYRNPSSLWGQTHRMVSRAAWLAGADAGFSGGAESLFVDV